MNIVYLDQADFRNSLLRMRQSGGARLLAVKKAQEIINDLQLDIDCSRLETNHGENRIKHAVKYDLPSACRLITVQNDGVAYLLFMGSHAEADRWLKNNEGLTIAADTTTGRIQITRVTKVIHEWQAPPVSNITQDNHPYFERVAGFSLNDVITKQSLKKAILQINEASSDEDVVECLELVEMAHPAEALVFLDMITELRKGNEEAALMRWKQHLGTAFPVTEDEELQRKALNSKANANSLVILNELSEEEQKRLFEPERFQDWMLFLHPDQKEIVSVESEQAIVLNGVSGSGKTCILVHRARHLAKIYPNERIGIITLNRSLARLIENLVKDLCVDGESDRIQVLAFYDYFKILLQHLGSEAYFRELKALIEPGTHMERVVDGLDRQNFANEFDPRSGETLEDAWSDFSDQDHFKEYLNEVAKLLDEYNVETWEYLREEFSLIRTEFPQAIRNQEYPKYERKGRGVPFVQNIREDVLRLLLYYQEYLFAGAILDELELAQAVFSERSKVRSLPPDLRFHSLLIDEYQDFSTLELLILRSIPARVGNLFLAGDATQKVLVKSLQMSKPALDIINAKWVSIRKNYRNSRQILKAASVLAQHYAQDASKEGEDVKILDPELAVRETCRPIAIDASDQIRKAWHLVSDCLEGDGALPWSVCIVTADEERDPIGSIIKQAPQELKAEALSGDHIRKKDTVVVGSIQSVKGFEFSMVVVIGCTDRNFPPARTHRDELWRHAFRLYVAMTRARDQVYLLFDKTPSRFLELMRGELTWAADPGAEP